MNNTAHKNLSMQWPYNTVKILPRHLPDVQIKQAKLLD